MANPSARPDAPAGRSAMPSAAAAARPTATPRSVRGQMPPRTMGATVPHERMRQVRFRSGIRDLVFGLVILVVGVLLNTALKVSVDGSDDLSRVGGLGLIVVGTLYAAYGVWGMLNNTRKPARTAVVKGN